MRSRLFLAVVLLLSVVVTVAVLATDPNSRQEEHDSVFVNAAQREVVAVQFLHRHGARSPLPEAAAAKVELCGSAADCGQLNVYGKAMLRALGTFLRQRYVDNSLHGLPGAAPPSAEFAKRFPGDNQYQHLDFTVDSTNVDRTLQSADSVIRGFFFGEDQSNLTAYYPIISTVSLEGPFVNVLMPGAAAAMQYGQAAFRHAGAPPFPACLLALIEDFAHRQPISLATLKQMGTECHMTTTCGAALEVSDPAARAQAYALCALHLQDTAACFEATGVLDSFPVLKANKARLDPMRLEYFLCAERFDPTDDAQRNMGATMRPWLQQVFQRGDAQIKAEGHGTFHEYSAHDTTIGPGWSALNHNFGNPETTFYMQPQFGEVLILELVRDTNSNEHYVQLWSGRPGKLSPPAGYKGIHGVPGGQVPSSH